MMKPISVDEQLPEDEDVFVLAYCTLDNKWHPARWWCRGWWPIGSAGITHWLPMLPAPDSDEWENQSETDIVETCYLIHADGTVCIEPANWAHKSMGTVVFLCDAHKHDEDEKIDWYPQRTAPDSAAWRECETEEGE